MKTYILGLAALAAAAAPAPAAVTVDQSALVQPIGPTNVVQRIGLTPPPAGQNVPPTLQAAVQTFTAGSSGVLSRLDFQAFNMGPTDGVIKMSLIDGDYAAGARASRLTQYAHFGSLPGSAAARSGPTLSFDTASAGFQVIAGTRYSVLFETEIAPGFNFAGLLVGTGTVPAPGVQPTFYSTDYAGGALYSIRDGNFLPNPGRFDLGFVSYVDGAVPEPATWGLIIVGFGAAGTALRRRPKAALA